MAETGSSELSAARPLLALPNPVQSQASPGQRVPPTRVRQPGPRRQGERLGPQFSVLRDALAGDRVRLSETAASPTPELVVVFDLAGSVPDFIRACRRIQGLEFLTDFVEDEIESDEDFYVEGGEEEQDGTVPQTLYLVMTNARAVSELVRLFELWQADPAGRLPTGLNPLKRVFAMLRAVRPWGPEDRVRETGLLDVFRDTVAAVGQMSSSVRVEIELWHRRTAQQRANAEASVREVLERSGGSTIRVAEIAAIGYHGLLADLPYGAVESVLHDGLTSIELLTTNDVMFVSPVRPMAVRPIIPRPDGVQLPSEIMDLGEPRIALLDGLPLGQHVTLRDRLVIDDADALADRYTATGARHGTAMASLIIHGDLAEPGDPIKGRLYVRPILAPPDWPADAPEEVPRDRLLVDVIHRAFLRMFEGEGSVPPSAPLVRVVNLSVGDPSRVFVRRVSPVARLLDWLSHKYNVVVVVSAGNHDVDVDLSALDIEASSADVDRLATGIARDLFSRQRHRRLYSPAESINAITVGAQHMDGSGVDLPESVIDPFDSSGPAPYSAAGSGFRRGVKPDVLMPGGRAVYLRPLMNEQGFLQPARTEALGPGMLVASPGPQGGLDGDAFTYGTSNAAALGTRAVDQILDVLDDLSSGDASFAFLTDQYKPVLAKALLVHAARWGSAGDTLAAQLGLDGRDRRVQLAQLLGYGPVDPTRIATADRVRAVLVHAGSIPVDQRLEFAYPLPPGLAATADWRRLTLTLAWLSPVNAASQRYRATRLEATTTEAQLGVQRVEADFRAARRGTVQHEIFEGERAVAFVRGDTLRIAIECKEDSGGDASSRMVRYGIAASIEVSPNVQIDVHEQVRLELVAQTQIRGRTRVRG